MSSASRSSALRMAIQNSHRRSSGCPRSRDTRDRIGTVRGGAAPRCAFPDGRCGEVESERFAPDSGEAPVFRNQRDQAAPEGLGRGAPAWMRTRLDHREYIELHGHGAAQRIVGRVLARLDQAALLHLAREIHPRRPRRPLPEPGARGRHRCPIRRSPPSDAASRWPAEPFPAEAPLPQGTTLSASGRGSPWPAQGRVRAAWPATRDRPSRSASDATATASRNARPPRPPAASSHAAAARALRLPRWSVSRRFDVNRPSLGLFESPSHDVPGERSAQANRALRRADPALFLQAVEVVPAGPFRPRSIRRAGERSG